MTPRWRQLGVVWLAAACAALPALLRGPEAAAQGPSNLTAPPFVAPGGPQLQPTTDPAIQAELSALRQRVEQLEASAKTEVIAPAPAIESSPQPPSYPTLAIGCFLQTDTAWFIQNETSRLAVGDLADLTAIRRARVHFTGDLRPDASYMIDLDFAASGHPSFRNMSLTFSDVPLLDHVQAGYFTQPFQMDAVTSSRDLVFVERALSSAFALFQQSGVGMRRLSEDKSLSWSVAGMRFDTDRFGNLQGDTGYGVVTRTVWRPWDEPGLGLLHLGGGYVYSTAASQTVQYQIQPGFFVIENLGDPTQVPPFVNTGVVPAANFNLFDLELAGAVGPLHFQAEATFAGVNQIGGPFLRFPGYYAQLSYILTGEQRQYDREQGVFDGVTPRENFRFGGGPGAWEIAARWSMVDLNDQNIRGGQLYDVEGSLNWYMTPHIKAQFAYVYSMLHAPVTDLPSHAHIVGGRVQFQF